MKIETRRIRRATAILALLTMITPGVFGREKDALQYGAGLIVNIPLPETEVVQAVQEVVQSSIIRGTKEYNKDEYITGAVAVSSSRAFAEWTEGGKVFFKERLHAIDPRNFKDSSDSGTLTVRYVVQPAGDEKSTVLRIDAIFVEDFRKVSHLSNGSIESAEYKDIHDHLESTELMKQQATEAEKENEERKNAKAGGAVEGWSSSASPSSGSTPHEPVVERADDLRSNVKSADSESPSTPYAADSESLQQRVQNLRQQVERSVKAPGAPLKSAPFHTASTLKSLASGTEVLIVISTPYWYGVETHEGQHGWMQRDELEPLR